MNFTPREKVKAFITVYAALFGLFIIGGFLWKILPHMVLGVIGVVSLCVSGAVFILSGLKQLRETHSNGQAIAWYQQYMITGGLTILCFLLSGSIIVICIAIIHAYPSQLMDYFITTICVLSALPVFVFGHLHAKANPLFKKPADQSGSEQAPNDLR